MAGGVVNNVGCVAFIAILLVAAGIEPNPGPTTPADDKTSSKSPDEMTSPSEYGFPGTVPQDSVSDTTVSVCTPVCKAADVENKAVPKSPADSPSDTLSIPVCKTAEVQHTAVSNSSEYNTADTTGTPVCNTTNVQNRGVPKSYEDSADNQMSTLVCNTAEEQHKTAPQSPKDRISDTMKTPVQPTAELEQMDVPQAQVSGSADTVNTPSSTSAAVPDVPVTKQPSETQDHKQIPGSDTDIEDTERIYFGRISAIIMEVCRDALWELLICIISVTDIQAKLRSSSSIRLGGNLRQTILKKRNLTSTDFDVPAVYALLRNVTPPSFAPARGWSNAPSSGDTGLADDVERVRLIRNELAHYNSYRLPEAVYKKIMADLEGLLDRIDGELQQTHFKTDLKRYNETFMDKSKVRLYAEKLHQLQDLEETVKDLQSDVELMKKEITSSKRASTEEWSRIYIQEGAEGDTFYPTAAYHEATAVLKKRGRAILSGGPGDGKSTLAANLISANYPDTRCILITSAEDIKYIDPSHVSEEVVLIEDIFSDVNDEIRLFGDWISCLNKLYAACSKGLLKLLITIRSENLLRFKDQIRWKSWQLFKDAEIVDCSTERLSLADMKSILLRHLANSDYTSDVNDQVEKCVDAFNLKVGFPLVCKMYCNDENLHAQRWTFFSKPWQFLDTALCGMRETDVQRFYVLGLVVFSGDDTYKIGSESKTRSGQILSEILELSHQPILKIRNAANSLSGSFIRHYSDNTYRVAHRIIAEAYCFIFGQTFPEHLTKLCDFDIFLRSVFPSTSSVEDSRGILVCTDCWVDRAQFEMNTMENVILFQHKALADKDIARAILPDNAAVNKTFPSDPKQWTPLHSAACADAGVVKTLLDLGACVNAKTAEGYTPLHLATGKKDCIIELLKHGADANALANDIAPLHVAAYVGDVECISALLAAGADVNLKTRNWQTPLQLAVRAGNHQCLPELKKAGGHCGNMGYALIHMSAVYGNSETVEQLIQGRMYEGNDLEICLYFCSAIGNESTLDLLLSHGVDPNGTIIHGLSPLHGAAAHGHLSCLRKLLQAGAQVDARMETGLSPLAVAAFLGQTECLVAMINAGADLNLEDDSGLSPLHYASVFGHTRCVIVLLDSIADVNVSDRYGNTPLHLVSGRCRLKYTSAGLGAVLAVRAVLRPAGTIKPFLSQSKSMQDPRLQIASLYPLFYLIEFLETMTQPEVDRQRVVSILLARGADVLAINCLGKRALEV